MVDPSRVGSRGIPLAPNRRVQSSIAATWTLAAIVALLIVPSLVIAGGTGFRALGANGPSNSRSPATNALQDAIVALRAGHGPSVGASQCSLGPSAGTATCGGPVPSASKPVPGGHSGARMVWDARDGYVVLFGGCSAPCGIPQVLSQTWSFKAGNWTRIATSPHPSARWDEGMAYDPVAARVVLFGGWNDVTYFNDTWGFHGGKWTNLSTTVAPPVRRPGFLVYDLKDHYLVMFGGTGGGGSTQYNDTWKFSAGTWTLLSTPVAPSTRRLVMADYTPNGGYILLFGGLNINAYGSGTFLNDTWTFVGGNWTQLALSVAPPARGAGNLAYDARAQKVILFGGSEWSTNLADTWQFSKGQWKQLTPTASPSARDSASMTYDRADGYVVLFGGQDCSFGNQCTISLSGTYGFANQTWTRL